MVTIRKRGKRIRITEADVEENPMVYTAVWDRANDVIIFYRPEFRSDGESYRSVDGEVHVHGDEVQSIALFGPKVRMIDQWLKDQIESAGLGEDFVL